MTDTNSEENFNNFKNSFTAAYTNLSKENREMFKTAIEEDLHKECDLMNQNYNIDLTLSPTKCGKICPTQ